MKKMLRLPLALALAGYPVAALAQIKASNIFYDSLVSSIDEASFQSYVDLNKGFYFAQDGTNKIVVEIPSNIKSRMSATSYRNQIQSGLMDFGSPGIRVKLVVKRDGVPICAVLKVRKLVFMEGGVIDTTKSVFDIVPSDPACANPQSETISALTDFVGLNAALGNVLQGQVLSARSGFRRCDNMGCATESAGAKADPIRKIQLFTTPPPFPGAPPSPGLRVTLINGSRLTLPNGVGAFWIGPNSYLDLAGADFSNETKDGSVNGANMNLSVGDGGGGSGGGELSFGGTFLALRKGSRLSFAGLSGKAGSDIVALERGSFVGELGQGSVMELQSGGQLKSSITFNAAELSLDGLNLQTGVSESSFSARSGSLKVLIDRASLNPTQDLKLDLGTTSFTLAFACHKPSAVCEAVRWTKAGGVRVQGTIAKFGSALKGGFLKLESGNRLLIEGGELQTGSLKIDTENAVSPISGSIAKLEIAVAAQDISFGTNISLQSGAAKLFSDNITVSENSSEISGTARLTGSLQELQVTGMGLIESAGLSSSFDLYLVKEPNQSLRFIKPSRFVGTTSVKGPYSFTASANFALRDIEYYDGEGSARWDLNITDMSAEYVVPGQKFSESKLTLEAIVYQREIRAVVNLNGPITLNDQMVRVKKGLWSLDRDITVSPMFKVNLSRDRLVDVVVQQEIGSTKICDARVNLQGTSYSASAKVSARVSSSMSSAKLTNFSISPTPQIDVDKGSCQTNLSLICAAVGSVTGGVGAIAAGAICYNQIGDLTRDFENNANRDIERAIDKLSFGN